jgi:monoamine oxidase
VDEQRREPLPMRALLDASFWRGIVHEEGLEYQATMFQPVGGMDRIAHAFAQKLGKVVKYGRPVSEIRKTPDGVRIVYSERGAERSLEASYCVCTMPLTVLKTVRHNLSQRVVSALNQVSYTAAYKIAWQSRRFWEQENNIYGGISWLSSGPISLKSSGLANVWYPSYGMFSEKGVLIAGYGVETGEFGNLPSIEAKLAASRAAVEKVHPGRSKELTKPVYVAWAKIPFSLGAVGPCHRHRLLRGTVQGVSDSGRPPLFCRRLLQLLAILAGRGRALGAARDPDDCKSNEGRCLRVD